MSMPPATLHVMRGIPGSGKSTKARELARPEFICSADDYFVDSKGVYVFKQHEIAQAHAACLKKFIRLVHQHHNSIMDDGQWADFDVVLDNTNLRKWEYESYEQIAWIAGMQVEFHEFVPPRDNTLGDYVRLCASRNAHGVSANQCMRMASIFENREGPNGK